MGRDITWPSGDVFENYCDCIVIANNYQAFRGSECDDQIQYGRRIWLDTNGNIKKGTNRYTMFEQETYAPDNFQTTWEVPVKAGDYMVVALRTAVDYEDYTIVSIQRLNYIDNPDLRCSYYNTHLGFETVSEFKLYQYRYNEEVPEEAYKVLVDDKFLKAVKKVLKVPKKLRKKGGEPG